MSLHASDDGNDSGVVRAHSAAVFRHDAPVGKPPADATAPRGRLQEDQASEIAVNVCRAAHRLRGLLAGHFGEFGLSDVRFAVLGLLRDCSLGGYTQAELAAHLDQSESSVSALVERMRDDNLLYRLRSKTDRRKRVLVLTEQGRHLLGLVEAHHGERVSRLLSRLEAAQLADLSRLLRVLVEELSRAEPAISSAPAESATSDSTRSAPHFDVSLPSLTLQQPGQHRPVA